MSHFILVRNFDSIVCLRVNSSRYDMNMDKLFNNPNDFNVSTPVSKV